MADPNDIYRELTPSGAPAPGTDQFGVAAGTPGFDPNSTARAAQAAAVEAARVARATSVGGVPVVTVAPNSAADEWNATFQPGGENYSLTPSQWNDLHPVMPIRGRRRNEELLPFENTQNTARDYHAHTAEAIARTQDAHKNVESADFAQKVSALDHSDPDYSVKFADLVATHPAAGGKLVDAVVADKQNVRETYLKALDKGGASAYGSKDSPTPAYNAFINTFSNTKDIAQAHAAAELTSKNEAALDDAAKKGLLTEADFPKWNDAWKANSANRPAVYNKDGSTNYQAVKKLIASREGAGTGLSDQRKQVTEDRQLLSTLGPQLDNLRPSDPNYDALHSQYSEVLNRLNNHSQALKAGNSAPAAPSPISKLLPPPRKPKG